MRVPRAWVLALFAGCASPLPPPSPDPFDQLRLLAAEYDQAPSEGRRALEPQIAAVANRHFDVMAGQLHHGDTERKVYAAFGLGFARSKTKSLMPLMLAAMEDGSPEVRRMAAAAVGRLGPDLEDEARREQIRSLFLKRLNDPEPAAREGALYGLSFLLAPGRPLGLLDALHERLGDEEAPVRTQAAVDLMIAKAPESIGPLSAQLRMEPDRRTRMAICGALGAISDPEANNGLIDALKDPETGVVKAAHRSLMQVNLEELRARGEELPRSHASWRQWWERIQKEYVVARQELQRAALSMSYQDPRESLQIFRRHQESVMPKIRETALKGIQQANAEGLAAYGQAMKSTVDALQKQAQTRAADEAARKAHAAARKPYEEAMSSTDKAEAAVRAAKTKEAVATAEAARDEAAKARGAAEAELARLAKAAAAAEEATAEAAAAVAPPVIAARFRELADRYEGTEAGERARKAAVDFPRAMQEWKPR